MGDAPHSIVLQALLMELGIRAKAWNIRVLPVHRVKVGGGRQHLTDICVLVDDQPLPDALGVPPLLCIEIVSPEDGAAAMDEKIEAFLEAGVKVVWEIYPSRKKAYQIVNGANRSTDTQLTVPGTDILVYSSEIFAGLHELDPDAWRKSVLND